MKLVASRTSPYARKVRVVLAEKRIEFDFVEENAWNADTTVPQFNPLNKVPVLLLDDDTPIFDSRVIVEFLDGVSPVSRLLPESGRERLIVKRWEALADGIVDAGVAIFLERKRPKTAEGDTWMARQRSKVDAGIAMAARDLGGKDFCHGVNLTVADIALACALFWLEFRLPEIDWRAQHPGLAAWADQIGGRPSFADTKPAI
ncbi:MAG: glutathione S-transferase N-terminal domain-containing protein [Betaproteobacteria bacterium]|nr:glutathione S-transferase N-terminal domain-containing protein [Betaproteobacteria bacterium]